MATTQSGGSDDDSLRLELHELVNQVHLVSGEIKLVVHEGSVQSITVRPEYRVTCGDPKNRITERRNQMIRLHTAEEFVRSQLEQAIVEKTGRFGSARLQARDGRVSDWRFTKRHKDTGKKNTQPRG